MNIKPVAGRLVKDPATGREITGTTQVLDGDGFWLRRLADGDVEQVAEHAETRGDIKLADNKLADKKKGIES